MYYSIRSNPIHTFSVSIHKRNISQFQFELRKNQLNIILQWDSICTILH